MASNNVSSSNPIPHDYPWQTLIEFTLVGESSSASLTTDQIAAAVQTLNWSDTLLEQLKEALTQAIRNIIERSRLYSSAASLLIRVLIPKDGETAQKVGQASDEAGHRQVSERTSQQVNRSTSRGWGFFLVQKQEDDPQSPAEESQYMIELFLYQESDRFRKHR